MPYAWRLVVQVRSGFWKDRPAVYKIWDLGDSFQPLDQMQLELDAYGALQDVQVTAMVHHFADAIKNTG